MELSMSSPIGNLMFWCIEYNRIIDMSIEKGVNNIDCGKLKQIKCEIETIYNLCELFLVNGADNQYKEDFICNAHKFIEGYTSYLQQFASNFHITL